MEKKYQVICVSFDGEYIRESPLFENIENAWEYSGDLGSKWYFYPFHFIVSGKTIADAPQPFEFLIRKRIKTVSKIFEQTSKIPELEGCSVDDFCFAIAMG